MLQLQKLLSLHHYHYWKVVQEKHCKVYNCVPKKIHDTIPYLEWSSDWEHIQKYIIVSRKNSRGTMSYMEWSFEWARIKNKIKYYICNFVLITYIFTQLNIIYCSSNENRLCSVGASLLFYSNLTKGNLYRLKCLTLTIPQTGYCHVFGCSVNKIIEFKDVCHFKLLAPVTFIQVNVANLCKARRKTKMNPWEDIRIVSDNW